ncbi:MAG: hypothetical protein R3F14_17795 [Polyangiaceae bacterium]
MDGPQVEPRLYELYLRMCLEAGFSPRIAYEVEHLASMLALVAAGQFSQGAVDAQFTSATFGSYLPFVAEQKLFMTSDDADVLGFSNTTCGTGAIPCNVDLYRGEAPPGMRLLVYVWTQAGHGNIACDQPAGISHLDWVHPYYTSDFKAYSVPDTIPCKDLVDPPTGGQPPVAEGHIHF